MHFIDGYFETTVKPKLEHYRRRVADGSLRDLLLVIPQPDTEPQDIEGVGLLKVAHRARRADRGGLFGEVTDPKHRPAIEAFVDASVAAPEGLAELRSDGRGAILMYLVHEDNAPYGDTPPSGWSQPKSEFGLLLTLSSYLPAEIAARYRGFVQFSVRKPIDSPTVDVD